MTGQPHATALPDTLRFEPAPEQMMSHRAQERRRGRTDYRDAVLAYRAAVATADDFTDMREAFCRVEQTRRRVLLPEDRRRVERELSTPSRSDAAPVQAHG